MGSSRGRHRAQRRRATPGRTRRLARTAAVKGPALGVLGVAAAGAAVVALTPTLSASPTLLATVYYLRGTNIGDEPTDTQYRQFMDRVFDGTGTTAPSGRDQVVYNAGFWPVSHGGLGDLTWNASVQQGLDGLEAKPVGNGDVIFGYSQGAVVASKYKAEHNDPNVTYVLVENPGRPNGGVMTRFEGLTIPILDVTFSGPTPDTDSPTIDVARQYDGWADFPTYPLNAVATANALMGIVYLHGKTQTTADIDQQLADIDTSQDSMYYQEHGNTKYYLIPTERLPLLMPLEGIVPDPILDAADAPLRQVVELGYDRSDYSKPTQAQLFPKPNTASSTAVPDTVETTAAKTVAPPTRSTKSSLAKSATGTRTDPVGAVASALKAFAPKGLAAKKQTTTEPPSFKPPSFKKSERTRHAHAGQDQGGSGDSGGSSDSSGGSAG